MIKLSLYSTTLIMLRINASNEKKQIENCYVIVRDKDKDGEVNRFAGAVVIN